MSFKSSGRRAYSRTNVANSFWLGLILIVAGWAVSEDVDPGTAAIGQVAVVMGIVTIGVGVFRLYRRLNAVPINGASPQTFVTPPLYSPEPLIEPRFGTSATHPTTDPSPSHTAAAPLNTAVVPEPPRSTPPTYSNPLAEWADEPPHQN